MNSLSMAEREGRFPIFHKNWQVLFTRYPELKVPGRVNWNRVDQAFRLESLPERKEMKLWEDSQVVDATPSKPLDNISPAAIWIVKGVGLGAHIPELLTHADRWEELLIIEPSLERFLYLCHFVDLSGILNLPQIEWVFFRDGEDLPIQLQTAIYRRERIRKIRSATFISTRVSETLKSSFEFVEAQWYSVCDAATSSQGTWSDTAFGLKNIVGNTNRIQKTPGIDRLENMFSDRPALICSTGPSLHASLPRIKEAADKCIIIAADASLKILLDAGIRPHFVCTLERDEESKPFFSEIHWNEINGFRPHLVSYPLVSPSVLAAFEGPQWISYRTHALFGHLQATTPRGVLASGHSVSHLCTRLADHLGCTEIVLVGQDLSFDPKTFASHSKGIAYPGWALSKSEDERRALLKEGGEEFYWGIGNTEERVPTSTFYVIFAREFSLMLPQLRAPIFNATEGGLRIPNMPWISLTEKVKSWKGQSSVEKELDELHERSTQTLKPSADLWASAKPEAQKILKVLSSQTINANTIEKCREEHSSIAEDPIAYSISGHLLGQRFIQLENEWACLARENASAQKKIEFLQRWNSEVKEVVQGFLDLVG